MAQNTASTEAAPLVLCIDDDPHVTQALELRLRASGVEVATANHGMHGIATATSMQPDVIITDVRMPQGAGDYVVERLSGSSQTRDIPVIVLTGCRDQELELRMRALGVRGYFTKPAPFEELREAVFRCLALKPTDSRLITGDRAAV